MPPASYQPDNSRVTNAILSTKLDNLTEEVRNLSAKLDRRITYLEERTDIRVGDLENQCHEMKTNVARLDERQKSSTGVLGAFTLIASSIAGVIGSIVK